MGSGRAVRAVEARLMDTCRWKKVTMASYKPAYEFGRIEYICIYQHSLPAVLFIHILPEGG